MPKIKYLIDEESKNRKEVTDKLKELKDIQLIEEDEKTKLRSPKHERDKELTLLEEIRQIYVTLVKTTQEKQKIGSIYEEKQESYTRIISSLESEITTLQEVKTSIENHNSQLCNQKTKYAEFKKRYDNRKLVLRQSFNLFLHYEVFRQELRSFERIYGNIFSEKLFNESKTSNKKKMQELINRSYLYFTVI